LPLSTIDVWLMGGALRDEPAGDSAYPGRASGHLANREADWDDPADDEANMAWARPLIKARELRPVLRPARRRQDALLPDRSVSAEPQRVARQEKRAA